MTVGTNADKDKFNSSILLSIFFLECYRKSPNQLALEDISDPKSLSEDELKRLIHEASKNEEKLIENKFSLEDPVLRKIIERDSHKISNDSKIYL